MTGMEPVDFISIMFLTWVDIVPLHKTCGSICWVILPQRMKLCICLVQMITALSDHTLPSAVQSIYDYVYIHKPGSFSNNPMQIFWDLGFNRGFEGQKW